ncbi:MAG TPA: hypothetical protein VJ418_19045, partial [Streptosporangiaceae bacterium]|nr:hypothetical protein [Streptosporangiaceae bacterium]
MEMAGSCRERAVHALTVTASPGRRAVAGWFIALVSKRVVVEHPVVAGGQGFIGTSHEIVVWQTAPELLFCRCASPGRATLSAVRTTV